jgi:hypothetical protein
VNWCVRGNRREKVGRWFQEENDDVWEHDWEYIDVRGRYLGINGTRRGRESARKIFERGARSGQRNAKLHRREGEEWEWKREWERIKKYGEEGESEIRLEKPVCQWRRGKIKSKSRVKGTKTQTSKKEGKESKNPDTTGNLRGVQERKFRSTWKERV